VRLSGGKGLSPKKKKTRIGGRRRVGKNGFTVDQVPSHSGREVEWSNDTGGTRGKIVGGGGYSPAFGRPPMEADMGGHTNSRGGRGGGKRWLGGPTRIGGQNRESSLKKQ